MQTIPQQFPLSHALLNGGIFDGLAYCWEDSTGRTWVTTSKELSRLEALLEAGTPQAFDTWTGNV
jgi:hypothetical protein